ncbi:hypothetical protein SLS58_001880 [Diplodia intermedia]|uniref:Ankyrin n=1 Tax=Diplodia intermedia TaxID=856260 RepID=A0ABR3U051_9PEZI
MTPLHYAAWRGFSEIVRLLLEHRADPNCINSNSASPAQDAAVSGHTETLKILVEYGADLSLLSLTNKNMHALSGSPETTAYLLQMNVDTAMCDDYGRPPIYHLLRKFAPNMMSLALQSPLIMADTEDQGLFDFVHVMIDQQVPLLKKILKRLPKDSTILKTLDVWPHNTRASGLCIAALKGDDRKLEILLEAGASIEAEGCIEGTPLMAACATGNLSAVICLVRRGARVFYNKGASFKSGILEAKNQPEVRQWLLVGRYTQQRKIGDSDINTPPIRAWSGPGELSVRLAGRYKRREEESLLDYVLFLGKLRRDLQGIVPTLGPDGDLLAVV